MNSTTYYELSQIESNDKPTWLQMYNGDMLKIDTGIHQAKVSADDAGTAAAAAQNTANAATSNLATLSETVGSLSNTLSTVVGNINTINSLIGNGSPTTSDQTVIGAINNLEDTIAPSEDNSTLGANYNTGKKFMRGGTLYEALVDLTSGTAFSSLVLNTDYKIADRITRQIDDLEGQLSGNYVLKGWDAVIASVTADGIKTQSALLAELRAAVITYAQSIPAGRVTELTEINIGGLGNFAVNKGTFISSTTSADSLAIVAHGASVNPSNQDLWEYALIASPSVTYIESYKIAKADGSLSTLIDGSFVPASGTRFSAGVTQYALIQ